MQKQQNYGLCKGKRPTKCQIVLNTFVRLQKSQQWHLYKILLRNPQDQDYCNRVYSCSRWWMFEFTVSIMCQWIASRFERWQFNSKSKKNDENKPQTTPFYRTWSLQLAFHQRMQPEKTFFLKKLQQHTCRTVHTTKDQSHNGDEGRDYDPPWGQAVPLLAGWLHGLYDQYPVWEIIIQTKAWWWCVFEYIVLL